MIIPSLDVWEVAEVPLVLIFSLARVSFGPTSQVSHPVDCPAVADRDDRFCHLGGEACWI